MTMTTNDSVHSPLPQTVRHAVHLAHPGGEERPLAAPAPPVPVAEEPFAGYPPGSPLLPSPGRQRLGQHSGPVGSHDAGQGEGLGAPFAVVAAEAVAEGTLDEDRDEAFACLAMMPAVAVPASAAGEAVAEHALGHFVVVVCVGVVIDAVRGVFLLLLLLLLLLLRWR